MNKEQLDLSRLSDAEELWLWRIRQPAMPRAGSSYQRNEMSRAEAAKFLGMSVERYKNLEAGRRINIAASELTSLAFLRQPRPEMSLREQLMLARHRSGRFIRQIAEDYGRSHTRLLAHEDMAHRMLIDYWTNQGFHGWNIPEGTQPQAARPRPVLVRRDAAPPPPARPTLLRRSA